MNGTRSTDEDAAAATPREVIEVERVREPLYARVTRLMIEPLGWRVYTSYWAVRVAIDASAVRRGALPTLAWNRMVSAAHDRVRRDDDRLVALSMMVVEQRAERMPIDVALRMLVADRPYVVRARERVERQSIELLRPGDAYTNDVCSLAYCSMHALDFDRAAFERVVVRSPTLGVTVPHAYRYSELVRQVVMARELESLHPLQRRCAVAESLVSRPQRTSVGWLYSSSIDRAVDYIECELAARVHRHAAFSLDPDDDDDAMFAVEPLGGASWASALEPHMPESPALDRRFECTVRFVVIAARVPRDR